MVVKACFFDWRVVISGVLKGFELGHLFEI